MLLAAAPAFAPAAAPSAPAAVPFGHAEHCSLPGDAASGPARAGSKRTGPTTNYTLGWKGP